MQHNLQCHVAILKRCQSSVIYHTQVPESLRRQIRNTKFTRVKRKTIPLGIRKRESNSNAEQANLHREQSNQRCNTRRATSTKYSVDDIELTEHEAPGTGIFRKLESPDKVPFIVANFLQKDIPGLARGSTNEPTTTFHYKLLLNWLSCQHGNFQPVLWTLSYILMILKSSITSIKHPFLQIQNGDRPEWLGVGMRVVPGALSLPSQSLLKGYQKN
uniref:Uncharacterized protein n=1 Tax=Glossina austeni TaxID=7395 RepID=A0A1A9V8K6_GLOAU